MAIQSNQLNSTNIGQDNFVIGTSGADQFTAGYGSDTIDAGNGDDTVYGGIGKDIVRGQNGNDYVNGDNGNDRVRGGEGNDAVFGGGGDDRVFGGWGDDIIAGNSGNDELFGGRPNAGPLPDGMSDDDAFIFDQRDGNDIVWDFNKFGDDKVVLIDGGSYEIIYNASNGHSKLIYGETTVVFKNFELTDDHVATIDFSTGQMSPGASDSLSDNQMQQIMDADPLIKIGRASCRERV